MSLHSLKMLANNGIVPIRLITTKSDMVALKRSFPKIFRNENKSYDVIESISNIVTYIGILFVIKIRRYNKIMVWLV